MRYVLDASVAIAAARPGEPDHAAAMLRIGEVFAKRDEPVVPSLFEAEFTAGLARRGLFHAGTAAFMKAILERAQVVPLGPKGVKRATAAAVSFQLRAADAFYVSVAIHEAVPFLTLDGEILTRVGSACSVVRP